MVSMSDDLKERNILQLILIVRFAHATLNVGRPIHYIHTFMEPQLEIPVSFSTLARRFGCS
jgi:hypothetical protein